jgi:hypothetical protein
MLPAIEKISVNGAFFERRGLRFGALSLDTLHI